MPKDNRRVYRSWLKLGSPMPRSTKSRWGNPQQAVLADEVNNDVEAAPVVVQPILNTTNPDGEIRDHFADPNDTNNSDDAGTESDRSFSSSSGSSSEHEQTSSSSFSQSDDGYHNTDNSNQNNNSRGGSVSGESEDETHQEWGPTQMPNLDDPIFPNIDCSAFECLLLVLTFSLRHGLTQVATQDLLKLINTIFGGEVLPTSNYLLKKIFGKSHFTYHFYCATENCGAYVGHLLSTARREGTLNCTVCHARLSLSALNKGNFFITFPIEEQLKFILESTDDSYELLQHRWTRETEPGVISDVYDGKIYRDFAKAGRFLSERFNLSLTVNTDGAVVFESSKNTLYPIHIRLNEFPQSVRFDQSKNLVCGLWFASKEPSMHLFMSTFVKEMRSLYENGFSWRASNGKRIHSKVMVLNCVFDSKCKPVVQEVKSFNGYFGCGYCYHPAVVFEGTTTAKYPMNDDIALMVDNSLNYTVTRFERTLGVEKRYPVDDRDNERMRNDMALAESLRNPQGDGPDVKGVKGKSVLQAIPYLDMVYGFSIDYLHCVLLGATRLVTGFWFDTTSKDETYYLNNEKLKEVDKRLLNIKPPTSISRRPRTLDERKNWHGNEWRNWLLYYSLPCLAGILPARYLKHHCLLVSGVYILLQMKITTEELQAATWYLGQYCVEFMHLYWPMHMNYNIHLLLHLGKCVYLSGPLHTFSCFSFEGANGVLVKLVKGSRGVLTQIADKYLKSTVIPKLLTLYNVSDVVIDYCDDLMCYRLVKNSSKFEEARVLGQERIFELSADEVEAFVEAGVPITAWSYERMILKGTMYHAKCYVRGGTKSNNAIVRLSNRNYGVLERIIGPQHFQGNSVKILVRNINLQRNSYITKHSSGAKAEHLKLCSMITYGSLSLRDLTDISDKAILLECLDNNYIADFPNVMEKD